MSCDISIVIVSWNVESCIGDCLDSIRRYCPQKYEVIVVDNGSSDNTINILKRYSEVKLIESGSNVGFSKANNIGVKASKGDIILFLNPDTILIEDITTHMLEVLYTNRNVGIVTPYILNKDLTRQSFYYSFPNSFFQVVFQQMNLARYMPQIIKKKYFVNTMEYNEDTYVGWTIGAVQMVRKSDLDQIGGYPDDIFMYYEDMDICRTFYEKLQLKTMITMQKIIHLGGESSKKTAGEFQILNEPHSLKIYFAKHYSKMRAKCIYYGYVFAFGTMSFLTNFIKKKHHDFYKRRYFYFRKK